MQLKKDFKLLKQLIHILNELEELKEMDKLIILFYYKIEFKK